MDNLFQVFNQSDSWDISNGLVYWDTLRDKIQERSNGVPLHIAVAAFVVLSPNNSERNNLADLERAVSAYRKGEWVNLVVHTYGANKEKARRVLGGENPLAVIKAPKTYNFYHNILYPWSDRFVTVDGHITSIWQGKRLTLDEAGVTRQEYEIILHGVSNLAKRLVLVPCQLQSILWLCWKRINRILYDPQLEFEFRG